MKILRWYGALLLLSLIALVLGACGAQTTARVPTAAPVGQPVTTGAERPTAELTASTDALSVADPASVSGDIIVAGSSTVFPVIEHMAELFTDDGYTGNLTIDSIGTGAGFERFCANAETDIANASRPIKSEEAAACQVRGREPIEFRIGTDALVVAVSSQNDFATALTKAQLAAIFSGTAKTWADVDSSWPAQPIQLFSPGTDSGTFDFFVEVVFDKQKEPLLGANPQLSEDDNVLVQGVAGSPYAIGYFGYAYYHENQDKLKALTIDGVAPNAETAERGAYPLSRPLFIYSSATIMKQKPQVAAFINFVLTNVSDEIAAVGYFPASPAALEEARQNWIRAATS